MRRLGLITTTVLMLVLALPGLALAQDGPTVKDLSLAYIKYAREYYQRENGPSPHFDAMRYVIGILRELDGNTSIQVRGQGTEFDSLREYVRGDDVRSIDWRATARAADVMVRTWRPERDRQVVLVLDTGRVSAGRVGDAPRLDAAMDAALLLAALASRAGARQDRLRRSARPETP